MDDDASLLNCVTPGADPDDWFPEMVVGKGAPARLRQLARQLCAGCPGSAMCLERALAEEAAWASGRSPCRESVAA